MRFLTALATLAHGEIRLDGTERMRERPLAPLIDGLAIWGSNPLRNRQRLPAGDRP